MQDLIGKPEKDAQEDLSSTKIFHQHDFIFAGFRLRKQRSLAIGGERQAEQPIHRFAIDCDQRRDAVRDEAEKTDRLSWRVFFGNEADALVHQTPRTPVYGAAELGRRFFFAAFAGTA